MTIGLRTDGRWSGGGHAVLANLRFAAESHPGVFAADAPVALVVRNRGFKVDRPYVLMPQNAWAWHGEAIGLRERGLRRMLWAGSAQAMRRASGLVRLSSFIPGEGPILPNVLDEGFEHALEHADQRDDLADVVVAIGNVMGYRNYHRLVHAFHRYRSGGGALRLRIIGRSWSPKVRRDLEAAVSTSRGAVEYVPTSVDRRHVTGIYAGAHAVVFASTVEASPISLLEASVVAPRVLASRIAGNVETADAAGAAPRWFDERSIDDIAEALAWAESAEAAPAPPRIATAADRLAERERWAGELVDRLEQVLAASPDLAVARW